jgi:hypothetical protein
MAIPVTGSPTLRLWFTALAFVLIVMLAGGVMWSSRRAGINQREAGIHGTIALALAALWLAVTSTLASRGVLHFDAPPTMAGLIAATFALVIGFSFSRAGTRLTMQLPLAALVGFQGFRVAVELLMHQAYKQGLMPVQMSYSGRNFDIISGATALLLGVWLATGHRSMRIIALWNLLGIGLLANILIVALLSAPTPLRVFTNEPANVWITQSPWVWLPTVMVAMAVLGHVAVYRRLRAEHAAARAIPPAAAIPKFGT